MVHLPHSLDYSCYVSRRILAPPPLRLQKHTDLPEHDVAHSPHLWHQPTLANVSYAWSWRLPGINPAVTMLYELLLNMQKAPPPSQSCPCVGKLAGFYSLDTLHFSFNWFVFMWMPRCTWYRVAAHLCHRSLGPSNPTFSNGGTKDVAGPLYSLLLFISVLFMDHFLLRHQGWVWIYVRIFHYTFQ